MLHIRHLQCLKGFGSGACDHHLLVVLCCLPSHWPSLNCLASCLISKLGESWKSASCCSSPIGWDQNCFPACIWNLCAVSVPGICQSDTRGLMSGWFAPWFRRHLCWSTWPYCVGSTISAQGYPISGHMGRWHKFFSREDLDVLELLREIVRFWIGSHHEALTKHWN